MATAKKNGLGKGLDSLITNKVNTTKTTTATRRHPSPCMRGKLLHLCLTL